MFADYECRVNFDKAIRDEEYALFLYQHQREQFDSLKLEERAYLAEQFFSLLKAIIQNPKISEEDIATITQIFPKEKIASFQESALVHDPAILRNDPDEKEIVAAKLRGSPAIVARLSLNARVAYAYIDAQLAKDLLTSHQAVHLHEVMVSILASHSATRQTSVDHEISFLLLEENFLSKLRPASKLLLFSKIQQIAQQYPEKFATLPKPLQTQIQQSFLLPLDGSVLYWISALACLTHEDYVTRFSEVLSNAKNETLENQSYDYLRRDPTPTERLQSEALTWILIHDHRFIEGWPHSYRSDTVYAKLTTEERFNLGLLYPKIAYALLTNLKCQGSQPFTPDEIQQLIEKHGYRVLKDPNGKFSNSTICSFYEQREHSRRVDFTRAPRLQTLAAHAFLKSDKKTLLPQELVELTADIATFEESHFKR